MFFSHAPAGYLLVKFARKLKTERIDVLTALIASVSPDFDMIYFYLIDERAHVHHSYWSHVPLFWFIVYVAAVAVAKLISSKRVFYYATLIFACIIVHLILDSVAVNGILWAYPFSMKYFAVFTIPPVHDWWVWNYVFHWAFIIEMIILIASLYVALRGKELPLILKVRNHDSV